MNITVSVLAEIPEELHEAVTHYLEGHIEWDQDRLFSAALSLFLLQNEECDRRSAQTFLDSLYQQQPA